MRPAPNLVRVASDAAKLLIIFHALTIAANLSAQEIDVVAARVGAAVVTVGQVEQIVARIPGRESFSSQVVDRLRAEALAELVNKTLVIEHLDRQKFLPNEKPWEARWVRYLADRVTDDDARKYFNEHRREFDGTELRVSHILLKIDPPQDEAATERALQSARMVRDRITRGELTFAAAARAHSAGPSRDRDGDLGFIGRRGPMVESFSRAAFALEPGQISEPVVSPFGVHLIQCTEVKPGKLRWEEVNRELRSALSARLLHKIAAEMRPQVKIEYTGASPYIEPATGKLVSSK